MTPEEVLEFAHLNAHLMAGGIKQGMFIHSFACPELIVCTWWASILSDIGASINAE